MAETTPKKRAPKAPKAPVVETTIEPVVETPVENSNVEEKDLPKIITVQNAKGKTFTVNKAYYLVNSHKLTIVNDA